MVNAEARTTPFKSPVISHVREGSVRLRRLLGIGEHSETTVRGKAAPGDRVAVLSPPGVGVSRRVPGYEHPLGTILERMIQESSSSGD